MTISLLLNISAGTNILWNKICSLFLFNIYAKSAVTIRLRKYIFQVSYSAGIHSLRHTFTTNLVNGIKQTDGSVKSLTSRQVADLLGYSTPQITELYYVKKDTSRLNGMAEGIECNFKLSQKTAEAKALAVKICVAINKEKDLESL